MAEYTFEQLKSDLDKGYQIYYTYMNKRYLVYKQTENCYSQELITIEAKNPLPVFLVVTLRRVKEIFPFMEDIEYKVT